MKDISKITLGTAQLGLNYGIANVMGKPKFKESLNILRFSWQNGINSFDTAPSYGNSEKIIGRFISSELKDKIDKIIITSKLSGNLVKENLTFNEIYNTIKKEIEKSLKNLGIKRLPIYLLHNASDLLIKDGIVVKCLVDLKNEGLIENFGVSIYNPEDAEQSLRFKEINVIQGPINIFDHRLIKTGLLKKLRKENYFIIARSIFLQGLFFKEIKDLPNNLERAKHYLFNLKTITEDYNISINNLALGFVRDLSEINTIIIGIETIDQITENLKIMTEKPLSQELKHRIRDDFSDISEKIINPIYWNI